MAVSVSVRIKAVRKALGLSQRAFCKGIFLSHSFYAQIESGTRKANERIYELISTKYNVNREYIMLQIKQLLNVQKRGKKGENKDQKKV